MEKESSFLIKFYLGFFKFCHVWCFGPIIFSYGRRPTNQKEKTNASCKETFKVAADSRCRSISVPLPKEILHKICLQAYYDRLLTMI